jgi:hypothetical protein
MTENNVLLTHPGQAEASMVDDPAAEQARRVQPIRFMERVGNPALEGPELTRQVPLEVRQNVLVTTVDKLVNWARKSSLWPVAFGLA